MASKSPSAAAKPIVAAMIPCLEEEDAIAAVVAAVLAEGVSEAVVVDGGSRDRTVERARAAGARVVIERERGYGRAMQAGIAAARTAQRARIEKFLCRLQRSIELRGGGTACSSM